MSIAWFITGWGVGFGVYSLLQVAALLTLNGWRRLLIALPIPFMVYILVITLRGEARGSNLWPIMMILFSPAAALGVALVWVGSFIASGRNRLLWLPVSLVAFSIYVALRSTEGFLALWSGGFTIIPAVAFLLVWLTLEVAFRARSDTRTAT
jgi:hypothetical protein